MNEVLSPRDVEEALGRRMVSFERLQAQLGYREPLPHDKARRIAVRPLSKHTMAVLNFIRRNGGAFASEIEGALDLRSTVVGNNIHILQNREFIYTDHMDGRRAFYKTRH